MLDKHSGFLINFSSHQGKKIKYTYLTCYCFFLFKDFNIFNSKYCFFFRKIVFIKERAMSCTSKNALKKQLLRSKYLKLFSFFFSFVMLTYTCAVIFTASSKSSIYITSSIYNMFFCTICTTGLH